MFKVFDPGSSSLSGGAGSDGKGVSWLDCASHPKKDGLSNATYYQYID